MIDPEALLAALCDAGERNPELAARLRRLCGARQDSPKWLPLRAAAAYCGSTVRSLRRAIAALEIGAVRTGRSYSVAQQDLDKWIASRAVRPRTRAQRATADTPASRAIARARRAGALKAVSG